MLKILKFSANWCSPCTVLQKTLNEVLIEYPEVVVEHIDIEENDELVNEYKIRGIPVLIFFKDDELMCRLTGSQKREELIEIIEKLIK